MTIYTFLSHEEKQYWELVQYCAIHNIKNERTEVKDLGGHYITYILVTQI